MRVKKIVKKYLEENGFDGLFASGECACKKDDLMPCSAGEMGDCEPGYFQLCGRSDERMDGWDFHIGPKKIEQSNAGDNQPAAVCGEAKS